MIPCRQGARKGEVASETGSGRLGGRGSQWGVMTTGLDPSAGETVGKAFRSRAFWVLLGALILTKLVALVTFARWADSDECVVGIMAKHILERGAHPLFFYGQYYGGGASIEAHVASVLYRALGISSISLKATGLVFSALGGAILFGLGARVAGRRAGLLTLLVFATMPPLMVWGLKTRGGYLPTLVLVPAMLWAADRLLRGERVDHAGAAAFLALAAIAYWNMQSALPLIVLVPIYVGVTWAWRRRFSLLAGYGAYLLVGVVGGVWWLSSTKSRMMDRFGEAGGGSAVDHVLGNWGTVVGRTLPGLFQPYINDLGGTFLWLSVPTLVVFLAGMAAVAVGWRRDRPLGASRATVGLVLVYIPFYVACCGPAPAAVSLAGRYLVPILPAMALVGGLALTWVSSRVAAVAIVYLVCVFVFFNAALIRTPRLQEHGFLYDPGEIVGLIDALDENGIHYARTTYIIEWRLLFESRERIIAVNLRKPLRYPPYVEQLTRAVEEGAEVGYVFRKEGQWAGRFLGISPEEFADRFLAGKGGRYRTIQADPYVIYVPERSKTTAVSSQLSRRVQRRQSSQTL
ncbi:MAG: hypothetical protein JXQ73_10865 [Phycisphaerae bacterium]|nr:hypothetical protein [Phycisphaerae bacterium]